MKREAQAEAEIIKKQLRNMYHLVFERLTNDFQSFLWKKLNIFLHKYCSSRKLTETKNKILIVFSENQIFRLVKLQKTVE